MVRKVKQKKKALKAHLDSALSTSYARVTHPLAVDLRIEMQQEDDYMSDAFLEELKDVRPGLLNREAKRKAKVCVILRMAPITIDSP